MVTESNPGESTDVFVPQPLTPFTPGRMVLIDNGQGSFEVLMVELEPEPGPAPFVPHPAPEAYRITTL